MPKKPPQAGQTALTAGAAEEIEAGAAAAGAGALDTDDGENAELEKLVEQFGGASGFTVKLERLKPEADAGYLGTLDLTPDFQDEVKRLHGGGRYSGRVYDGDDYQQRIKFRIAGAPLREPAAVVAAPAPAAHDRLGDVLAEMNRTNARIAELIAAGQQPKGGLVSSLEEFAKVAEILKTVGGGNAAANGGGDVLAIVDRVMNLQDKIAERVKANGGNNDENEFLAVMREGIVPILEMGRDYLRVKTGAPVTAPGANGASAGDAVQQLASRLPVIAKKMLAGKAKAGANAELYAEFALDQLSDNDKKALFDILNTEENFGERIAAAVPEFNGGGAWFGRFGMAARGMLEAHFANVASLDAARANKETKGGAGKGRTKKAATS
jgi:hypothetical protein